MQPLLSIAIPTFNRAQILDNSLGALLPQIQKAASEIEFIISDNASPDYTQEVISKYISQYPELNIISNIQPYNTGYYGNFKKCRELANGKYFWLLSDNEQLLGGVVDLLLTNLKQNSNTGTFFFDNVENNGKSEENQYSYTDSDFNALNKIEKAYLLTLTSSVVFLNEKKYDKYVNQHYHENSFLGFLYLGNALRKNKNIKIIKGRIFDIIPCNVSFNIFESWTEHIIKVLDYYVESEIINLIEKEAFITSYLKNVVSRHVYNYKLNGMLYGKKYGSVEELGLLLDKYYENNMFYIKGIKPLFIQNLVIFKIRHFIKTKNYHNRIRIKMATILFGEKSV